MRMLSVLDEVVTSVGAASTLDLDALAAHELIQALRSLKQSRRSSMRRSPGPPTMSI